VLANTPATAAGVGAASSASSARSAVAEPYPAEFPPDTAD
jgi:hypothetical protein